MEEAGAAWLKDQPAVSTSKRETGAKPKAKTAEVKAENGTGDGEEEGADPEPPQPRTKSQRKPLPKSANSATKRGQKAKASDTEGEDATNESAPPGKKAKVTHQAASEDQEEVGEQIKNELGADGVDDGAMKDVKDEAEED